MAQLVCRTPSVAWVWERVGGIPKGLQLFLHEHPRSARSWDTTAVKRVLSMRGVGTTVCDQCLLGLTSKTKDGQEARVMKPMMWMSKQPIMLMHCTRRCDNSNYHKQLLAGSAGNRSRQAENYPLDLVHATICGMAETNEARKRDPDLQEEQWDMVLALHSTPPSTNDTPPVDLPTSTQPCADGTTLPVTFEDAHFKNAYRDEHMGASSPAPCECGHRGRNCVV